MAPESLKKLLDRCVKCGLCLPECPTYRLSAEESESPRGRLALIEGLVEGRLEADAALRRHLDHCLGCRRCERVCPSAVPFGQLITGAHTLTGGRAVTHGVNWLQNPSIMTWASRVARAIPARLSQPIASVHRMHRVARALKPVAPSPAAGEYRTARPAARGRVGLFTGCATAAQQGGALQAAIDLLRHCGFDVFVPGSVCCGALSAHAGNAESADRLAERSRAAFPAGLDAIVSIASGCGNHLDSYQPPLPAAHFDICRFLIDNDFLQHAAFRALPESVLLHVPCSVENVYRGSGWSRRLLAAVPGLTLEALASDGQCCGAAGDYMLRYPVDAAILRQPLLDRIAQGQANTLLTTNVGCAMHIAEGLTSMGRNIDIMHPVELLLRCLR